MNPLETIRAWYATMLSRQEEMRGQLSPFGLPAWANALVGLLIAVLFISLFYGIVLLVGGILSNTILNTPGGNIAIGGTTNTAYSGFNNLFQYVFTVGSFTGVAIVLAVVAVVFIVFYFLLGGGSGAVGGGRR